MSARIDDARALVRRTLIWDNHACMPLRPRDPSFLPQLARVRAAGADVVSLNIGFGPQSLDEHLRNLAAFRAWIAAHDDAYVLVSRYEDIETARTAGKLAIVFDIEGLAPFDEGDYGLVAAFADLGVRWGLIAYNRNNASGGGCMDEDTGLTAHGRAMIGEMRRVGMLVCCSHTGHRTARDVMALGDGPVIFSHSNASAVHAHARNIPDDLIRDCASTGGVVGVNGIGNFLGGEDLTRSLADHIDHMVSLVGPDHVGLGLDYVFDQEELKEYLVKMRTTFPDSPDFAGDIRMAPPECIVGVTAILLERGYGEASLTKILGGNWARLARENWR